jgi:hypothetical protein
MVLPLLSLLAFLLLMPSLFATSSGVLKRSDVVFMYQADRGTYVEYGATVLAWGGNPTPESLEEARGIKFFGSVGMVTEFSRYYERFPESYEEGLCRDIQGDPVKVPWLTDHQHKGVPYWWCCTQQPNFREFIRERVLGTVSARAYGVHIDDHMGTAGGLWLGICFCDRCVAGFRSHLESLPAKEREELEVSSLEEFDYRAVMRAWLEAGGDTTRRVTDHPLWPQWVLYQCRAAADFMHELKVLASETAGRPVPLAANAGLLWPRHLVDYKSLSLFSAETEHEAEKRRFSDLPLVAYRLADAVERPLASTASGQDWAFIKEHDLPGLVRGWIALSYAAGHSLMAPHRQWCYTPEGGTHWYDGPAGKFAPLYQFVRGNTSLFDDYEAHADLAVVIPHRSYVKDRERWFDIGRQLSARNIAYRLILAGDELVDRPLSASDLQASPVLLIPDREEFLPRDRDLIDELAGHRAVYKRLEDAVGTVKPAVHIQTAAHLRVLPRVKAGSAVVHLLNYGYDPLQDRVRPLVGLKLQVDLEALGVPLAETCRLFTPGASPAILPIKNGVVEVPELDLWAILQF